MNQIQKVINILNQQDKQRGIISRKVSKKNTTSRLVKAISIDKINNK